MSRLAGAGFKPPKAALVNFGIVALTKSNPLQEGIKGRTSHPRIRPLVLACINDFKTEEYSR